MKKLPLPLLLTLGAYLTVQGHVLAQSAATVTIKHDEGTATLRKNPQRIIAMDEESLGWLAALGLQSRVVGIGSTYFTPTDLSGTRIKPEVLERGFYGRVNLKNPTFVGDWQTPNLETITALKPDLIVRLTWDGNQNYDRLSRVAPVIAYKEGGEGFWQKGIRDLGRLFGREAQAETAIRTAAQTGRTNAQKLNAAGILKRYPKAIVLAPFTGGSNWLYTDVRLVPEVQALGFRNGLSVPKTAGVGTAISDEALLGLGKDTLVILFPPGGRYNGADAFLKTAVGQRLKDQSVLYVPDDFNPYTGPLMSVYHSNKLTSLILDRLR
ncbi:ABC transporter substrate-binding protein [Deinococcus sp. 12RED42]|uniref:ABC transporter substrate-binding protein n=1 Tax=Deinococcus sp. 12RED42 TaxID=2745872 RepID=UPI001E3D4FE8